MTPINKLPDLTETEKIARQIAFQYTEYLDAKQVFALEDEIKRAIEAEREACAQVAQSSGGYANLDSGDSCSCNADIAAAIRARK